MKVSGKALLLTSAMLFSSSCMTYALNSFYSDVSPKDSHYKAIKDSKSLGLLPDYGDKFDPNKPVTRAELAESLMALHDELINSTMNAVAHVTPLVVLVLADVSTPSNPNAYIGSGVVLDKNHILTAYHVVDTGILNIQTLDQNWHKASIAKFDKVNDLAILEVSDITFPDAISLADTATAGDDAITIGHPSAGGMSLDYTVSKGIISYADRQMNSWKLRTQVDTPINDGNSGGPVFDLSGKLIGIVTSGFSGSDKQNINFIAPLDIVKSFINSFYHPSILDLTN